MTGLPGARARATGSDIRVEGSRIREIGRLAPRAGERVIDARDCVIYPGWVNTHHHLMHSLLKGVPQGMNAGLHEWLRSVPFHYRMRFTEEALETAALLGLSELALGGCTTVADFHSLYYPGMPYDAAAILFAAAKRIGVRFILCRGVTTRTRDPRYGPADAMPPEAFRDAVDDVVRTAAAFHDRAAGALRRVAVATPLLTQSLELAELRDLAAEARRLGLRLHAHLAETQLDAEYCQAVHHARPLEFARTVEWVGPDTWFAHLVHIDDADVRILADTRTAVAHCPGSNCRLGSGVANLPAMARAGVRIGIGQDGGSANEPGHMLADVHLAWYLHRSRNGAAAVTIEDVLHWATRSGAEALGLDMVGAIAPGLEADLAIYGVDDLCFAGFHDLAIAPIATGIRPHLKHLLVGGRTVAENGCILGLDLSALRARVRHALAQLRGGDA